MDNGLRVELPEPACVATPGEAVTTRCVVYNTSRIVDDYRLTVSGVDPSWVEAPAQTARLFPEGVLPILVTFTPPREATATAGDYPFTVTFVSTDNPGLTASVNGTLTVDPMVDFSLQLDGPRQLSGEVEGRFAFRLANSGNAAMTFALDAKEETGQLELQFLDQSVEVPAGATRAVTLIARPTPSSLDQAGVYQIEVGATIAEISSPQSVAQDLRRKTSLVTFQTVPVTADPPVLSPQNIELGGQQTETELVLRNRSATPRVMALSGSDKANALAFEFVGGDRVTVPSQGEVRVQVQVACLDRTKLAAPPAPTAFTITATPIEPSGEPQTVAGELTQPELADIRLQLDPELASSTAAVQVRLSIGNASARPATFAITAMNGDPSLTVTPAANRIEVGANDRVVVPVELFPNPATMSSTSTGQPRSYSIDVAPIDAPAHAKRVSGRHVYVPITSPRSRGPRWRYLLALAALLLALGICGVAYTGLLDDEKRETPVAGGSGAEAASLVSPTADGMGTDGSAAGDGSGGGSGDENGGDPGDNSTTPAGGSVNPGEESPTPTGSSPDIPTDPTATSRSGGDGTSTGATFVVSCEGANLRSDPSADESNVIATLDEGTTVETLGSQEIDSETGDVFVEVLVIETEEQGFVSETCLELGGFDFGGDAVDPGQQQVLGGELNITGVSFYRPSSGDDSCKVEVSVRNNSPQTARDVSVSAEIHEDAPLGVRYPYGTYDLTGPSVLAPGEERIYYNDPVIEVHQGWRLIYSVEVSVGDVVVARDSIGDLDARPSCDS